MNKASSTLFCANCQAETEQLFIVSRGELIAECGCGRFLKWPAGLSKEEIAEAFQKHSEHNRGQFKVRDDEPEERHPILDAVEGRA